MEDNKLDVDDLGNDELLMYYKDTSIYKKYSLPDGFHFEFYKDGNMSDWINATDDLLKFRRKEVLNNSGSISHKEAVEKAEKEYEKFRVIQDQKYISSMDEFYNRYLNETRMIENGSD